MATALHGGRAAALAGIADRGLLANQVIRTYKRVFGRGPTKASVERAGDDCVVVHLRDFLTVPERVLVDRGHARLVADARRVLHDSIAIALASAAERATGRDVTAVALRLDPLSGTAAEVFTLGTPRQ